MNDLPTPQRDPLDEFLTAPLPPTRKPEWKQLLLRQTTQVLRRRQRWKRLGYVVALAACYAAGALTMRFLTPPAPAATVPEVVQRPANPEPRPVPSPAPPVPAADAGPSALALEWQAAEEPDRRVEFLRRAGDRYLTEENDLASAVRCYKNALNAGSEEDLKVAPQDNWLLMSLKNARLEEIRHARNDS